MAATLHAFGILALVAATAFACFRGWAAPDGQRTIRALLAGLVCLLIYLASPGHLCNRGNPTLQVLIGSACVTSLLLFIRRPGHAAGLAAAVVAVTVALAIHHLDIVHSPEFTGNPRDLETRRLAGLAASAAKEILESKGADPKPSEAGWLDEKGWITGEKERFRGFRIEIRTLWHTAFTGLLRRQALPVALWYPGGPPAEGAGRLEWRDRP
ncbi:MAG TPA: hypothetical protein VJB14_06950 [Planctomycetota bacterium]|nr:hypothetical protein [Planctomycetota bacterium]